MSEKIFRASVDELPNVLSFAEEVFDEIRCPLKISMQLSVAIEEMFVNIAHYAYPDKDGNATVDIDFDGEYVSVSFSDSGIEFNPLEKSDPDITLSAEERSIGGLGIFMVKKSMDEVLYERKDGNNIFTMRKKVVA